MIGTVTATVSTERVEIETHDDGSMTASLFLGNRRITGATVAVVEGGWASGSEAIFAALAGLLRHAMATCPMPVRREAINADAMLYIPSEKQKGKGEDA